MRSNFLALAAGVLFSTALFAQQEERETIEGNDKLVTRNVDISSFNKLHVSGVYELVLSQGDKESVKIEADENLQELITVKNEGDQLIIDMKKLENKGLRSKNKMRIYVTFKTLKELELKTVGNVTSEEHLAFDNLELNNKSVGNIKLNLTVNNKLDLENSSVGNVTLSGKAQNAVFLNTGVGSLKAGDLIVQTLDIDNSGIGSAEVNAEKELKVKDNMMGKVKNKGTATARRMNKVVI